jgi:nucleoside-triphosphatase THEP1
MELMSQKFSRGVHDLFSKASSANFRILATIPISKGRPLPVVEALRQRTDCRIVTVKKDHICRVDLKNGLKSCPFPKNYSTRKK